ncbi:ribonuclease [Brevundimonas naejangsanensis]|uniref:Ribonuclease n=1 Tax=Brevundimonas naejangsanensis TaxID=588932 RepID=A0A172Y2D1_9CAUL|nr:ribonuclease [Brevundimonas naejangsanensis]ANF53374.1 ribonuclease [Brevundimonas naejangsanensis]
MRIPFALAALTLLLGACTVSTGAEPEPTQVAGAVCDVPDDLRPARPYRIPQDEVAADVAVAFNMLAVSWSPQACRSGKDYPDARYQCAANQFGLTLHGLWPNGADNKHPRYCAAPGPAIAVETVRRHFCMIPSPSLQQHEWAAHGTCGWDSPEAYFAQAAKMWDGLNKPDLEAIPTQRLTAGAIRDAFVAANPGFPRDGVFIATTDGWFREARLCYSRDYRPMRCPRGLGAPDRERLKLAPKGVQQDAQRGVQTTG